MNKSYLLAIDQGTTNSRALLFRADGSMVCFHEIPIAQYYPHPGWVEQQPDEMVKNTIQCCHAVLKNAGLHFNDIACIGISNQRETTIIWDKKTGKAVYPAIVWQDRRTAKLCDDIAGTPIASQLQKKTGLVLDPYFSATKIMWLLSEIKGLRKRAERGEVLFGTVDTYLLWRLTGGKSHLTDITNASRTMLCHIEHQTWDPELLAAFDIPRVILPTICNNTHDFGLTEPSVFGASIPISGMAGDQQAATIGQGCFDAGDAKMTFGTGGFMLINTGKNLIYSSKGLLSTIAYRTSQHMSYGIEGSFFSAGVSIKWLRDTLKLIRTSDESEIYANSITDNGGMYLVPAFTGLGAPYWQPEARAMICGLTRNIGPAYFARAALESVAYQTRDLLEATSTEYNEKTNELAVDGGMAANQWLLQFLADICGITILKPACIETSALGAAYLAGLQIGIYTSLNDIKKHRQISQRFRPKMSKLERDRLYSGWKEAINKLLV